MKQAKIITAGLALMLAVFLLLFLATEYIGYHPTETALKDTSKAELFFDQNEVRRDYLRLFFLLCISAACCILFERLPELGVFAALFPLGYSLLLLTMKRLTKRPMVIVILCLAHLCGAVIYCGYRDRQGGKHRHASNASLLCSLGALGCAGFSLFYLSRLRSVSAELQALKEAEIAVNVKVRFVPDFVRMVAMKLQNFGREEAQSMMTDFNRKSEMTPFRIKIMDTIQEEQFANYLRLAILLFGTAVLVFALRRKLKLIPVLLSALPVCYAAIKIFSDGMSAFSMPILAASLFSLICAVAAYDQYGKGHDPVYDAEPVADTPTDESEEIYYT